MFGNSAAGPASDTLKQLIAFAAPHSNSQLVSDLRVNLVSEQKLHFKQFLFRLQERATSLEQERERLQKELEALNLEMDEIVESYGEDQAQLTKIEEGVNP